MREGNIPEEWQTRLKSLNGKEREKFKTLEYKQSETMLYSNMIILPPVMAVNSLAWQNMLWHKQRSRMGICRILPWRNSKAFATFRKVFLMNDKK